MIGLEDRQFPSQGIGVAHAAGARLDLACEVAGIDVRTLQRWKAHEGLTAGDGRPQAVRPRPGHALSEAERAELVRVANEPRFAAVPPAPIVPMLADDGVYLASESSFSRVLLDEGQAVHRVAPRSPALSGRRPRTWPRRRDSYGAGT
jgi:putative transposase